MNNKDFDLVVIGAGATGACLAYEASKRSLKVALIDSGDISGGTSSRSTKLLHGGVRYLELAFKNLDLSQLNLVREALVERAYWLENAPFLTRKIELAMPSNSCLDTIYYRIGLEIYDQLSGKKSIGSSRTITRLEMQELLPNLSNSNNGGVAYSDGQFNDARLNLLQAITAEEEGTLIKTYCKVVGLEKERDGMIRGVITQDNKGVQQRLNTKVVINATGVNCDQIRRLFDEKIEPRVITSRGIHMVLKENLCPKEVGLLIPKTDDGRVLFILPFFGYTLVGTTDTQCESKNAFAPSEEEKKYLLKHLKLYFPELNISSIRSCWAGGRPLIKNPDSNITSSKLVREHEIESLKGGLISNLGGKWTTCRSMAFETLSNIEILTKSKLPKAKNIPILGCSKNTNETKKLMIEQRSELRKLLPKTNMIEMQINHLQSQYGLEALSVITKSSENKLTPLSEVIPLCEAEIEQSIFKEHAITPTDILARRFRLAMVDQKEAERLLPIVQKHLDIAGLPPGDLDLKK